MIRRIAALLVLPLLAGCITPLPDISQSRSPCQAEPGGWCGFVRDAAVRAWPYAMLSANAYDDEDTYTTLPAGFVRRSAAIDNETGLAYHVYDRFEVTNGERGRLAARVIVFRGTDAGSFADLFRGSLGSSQIELARKVVAAESAELALSGHEGVPIELTGHSLGGALATQISIDDPSVTAIVFNTSPLFDGDPALNAGQRLSLAEYGEFLRLVRRYRQAPAADSMVINCNPTAGAGSKHSIRRLADCLTWIAAYADPAALALLEPNRIVKPEVECGPADKVHPGSAVVAGVCRHSAGAANRS